MEPKKEVVPCPRCYTGNLKDAKEIAYCQPCQKAMAEFDYPTPSEGTR